MFTFKLADLKIQRENFDAYTVTPAHHLKSISASAISFLDRNTNRTPLLAQPTDVLYTDIGNHDMVLGGLQLELDTYLHEPLMKHAKVTKIQGPGSNVCVEWCDPLRYWTVRVLTPYTNTHFSLDYAEC